jgi:hydrophobic/amphiphilic exporter-1 (mainly G- bacteria), HAE1 family
MNWLIKFSLKNASVLVLVTVLVLLAGVFTSFSIKQELLPEIRFPVITVITPYPLASPEIVENQVTRPIETALQGIADLESIQSTSSPNVSVVVLSFGFSANLREKESQIQQAVNRVRGNFPEGVQDPNVSAIRFGDAPVVRLALSGDIPVTELKQRVDARVLPKLEGIAGVSRVDVTGAPKAQIRITLDEQKLSKYRLDANAINQALRASSLAFPVGSVQDNGLNVPVKLDSVASSVASLAGVVVTAQPDQKEVEKLTKQARDAQIAAARAQAQALQGVAQLAGQALATAGQAAGLAGQALGQAGAARGIATGAAQAAGQAAGLAGQALGQAGAARGIATGAAQAAGAATQLAGQALATAKAADAKADAALKAAQNPRPASPDGGTPIADGQAPGQPSGAGQPPAGFSPPSGATGQPPAGFAGTNAQTPSGATPPAGFSMPGGAAGQPPAGFQMPSGAPSGFAIPNNANTFTAPSGAGGFGAPSGSSGAAGYSAPSGAGGFGAPSGAGGFGGTGGASFGGGATSGVKLVPVTLAEVAKIELTTEDPKSFTRLNGDTAVGLNVFKTQAGNTLTVANAVKLQIPELEKAVGGKITVLQDQGAPIQKGVESLVKEGILGGLFAVLIVFIFLRNLRSTFITAISIPLSILVGLLFLGIQGFTLNVLTLGGLAIAIGRVIDDAIVVIENIYHRLSLGDAPLKAAYEGAREVVVPITASTITTVAVFLPLAFVGGIAGEFFRPLALAVTYSILASLIVAFTVIPLFSSLFLRSAPVLQNSNPSQKEDRFVRGYRAAITWATGHKAIVLIGAVVLLFASSALVVGIPTNFVGGGEPTSAEAVIKFKDGTRLARINQQSRLIEEKLEILRQQGKIKAFQTVIGTSSGAFAFAAANTGATANFTVLPGGEENRKINIRKELVPLLEKELKGVIPNTELSVQAGAGGGFSQNLEVQIQAENAKTLRQATEQVLAAAKKVPEVRNPSSNLDAVNPEFVVRVDQKKAYEKGIIPVAVGGTVRQALQGAQSITLSVDDRAVEVLLTAPSGSYQTLEQVKNIKLRPVSGGNSVRLSEIASVTQEPAPSSSRRIDGERTAVVTMEPAGNNVGASTQKLTAAVKALTLPTGATWKIGGVSASQAESFQALGVAILAAIALVYVIMVATFRSLLTPFLLLVSIPLVVIGAFPLLFVTQTPIDLAVFFGFLLLVGIVVTNAIVLIDLVDTLQEKGMDLRQAIIEGGSRRVRPIVMTALTTILALSPAALELFGASSGIVGKPLALTVIGGLTASTMLTLFVVPALYLAVYGRRKNKSSEARVAKQQQMLEVFGD